jgi:hypothetical protein
MSLACSFSIQMNNVKTHRFDGAVARKQNDGGDQHIHSAIEYNNNKYRYITSAALGLHVSKSANANTENQP